MDDDIRVRACLAVVKNGRILLVPHYATDVGPVQWNLPGGRVRFEESLTETARREFREETGLEARVLRLLDVSEIILPERPWHSITVTFAGEVLGGKLTAEAGHLYGTKAPHWLAAEELREKAYHPRSAIEAALSGVGCELDRAEIS